MRGGTRAWIPAACALLLASCGKATPAPATSSTPVASPTVTQSASPDIALGAHFENASLSVDYPADWRQRDLESGALFVAPDGGAVVGVEVAKWSKTLAKLARPAEDIEKGAFASFQLDGTADAALDGEPAVELMFHGVLRDGTAMRGFAFWSVVNGRAYRFGFKANTSEIDDLLPAVRAMMESFRVL